MGQKRKTLISVVVPVYNEEGNVQRFYDAVSAALGPLSSRYDFEFIFTDNHSEDLTFELLKELARKDSRIRAYRFSRNFGFQRSILGGYRLARGAAAIQIDCDLQDPPDVIPEFIAKWEEGYAVVYGIRSTRPEALPMRAVRKLFYRLLDRLSETELPHDAGDFRLVDRRVLDIITNIDDSRPYLRGMIANVGFRQTGVSYDRNQRLAGDSKFSLRDLIRLALDAIANHSVTPLKIASLAGVAIMLASVGTAIFFLVNYFYYGDTWPPGFATLIIALLFLSGMNALFLGLMGEYIGRIYLQVKRRPTAIIEAAVDGGAAASGQIIKDANLAIDGRRTGDRIPEIVGSSVGR